MDFTYLPDYPELTARPERITSYWLSRKATSSRTKTIILAMKLTGLLLTAAFLQVGAKSIGQTVTFSGKDVTMQTVFQAITQQTGYTVFYNYEVLSPDKKVTVDVKNASLDFTLKETLKELPLTYNIIDRTIVIKTLVNLSATKIPITPTITMLIDIIGKITNENGEPVEGVSVRIKGNKIGTTTNATGEFRLDQVETNATLQFSGTNVESREMKINGQSRLNIQLKTKVNKLDEIQVVAYGTVTQRMNVGSVTKVTSKEIEQQPVSNPLAALQGRVPGLVVTSTSGLPGAAIKVQIRGQNSLNPSPNTISVNPLDNPLFIIDGVPFAAQNSNINQSGSLNAPGTNPIFGNPYGGMSPFNSINPTDIESIEVLRDADATSIYGSRGANGVVIITTKKGKAGISRLNINAYTGVSRVTHAMPMMNTEEYLSMRKEALTNDGLTASTIPWEAGYSPDLLVFDTTKYTDWRKYFLGGSAYSTDINGAFSGGTANTQFLIGSGYHHESYIFPGNFGDSRVSFNINLLHNSTDRRLSIELSANYSYDQNNSAGSSEALRAFTLPPNHPDLLDKDGNLIWDYKGIALQNPLGYLKQKYSIKAYNLIGHLNMSYELAKGFSLKASMGYNNMHGNEISQVPKSTQNPINSPRANASFNENDFASWIVEPQAEYKTTLGKGRMTAMIGGTFQQNSNSMQAASGYGYSSDALLGSISAADEKYVSDAFTQYKYVAIFGRLNYIWNNKYIINLNSRRDGSSRFGPGKQFGNFGSAGAGWIFSEESFIKNHVSILSYGKLRVSYGIAGNDNIGDYQYLSRWSTTSQAYGLTFLGTNGYVPINLYNPGFSWSVTRKLESGLEFGLLKDRILFNIAWFRHRSSNQLVTYLLPRQTGFQGVIENFPALVENRGWEVSINVTNVKGNHFTWTSSFNITFPKNKLISFPGIENSSYSYTYVEGQSLNVLKKLKLIGVNPSTGLYEFDTKSGPTTNPDQTADAIVIGNLDPKLYGGLSNALTYKRFQLDIFIEFKRQKGANYLQQVYSGTAVGFYGNQPAAVVDRWQNSGDRNNIEKLTVQYGYGDAGTAALNYSYSDGAYSDASYIRFKTISFSYAITDWMKNLKIENCKIYLHAQNLSTITKYKGNDPETQSFYSLPPIRTVVAGIQFTF